MNRNMLLTDWRAELERELSCWRVTALAAVAIAIASVVVLGVNTWRCEQEARAECGAGDGELNRSAQR